MNRHRATRLRETISVMWAASTASGSHASRSHTVGYIGLALAVALTFLVLWAVFFRGAASEVSHQGGETAGLAPAPAPSSAPATNNGKESAATPPAARRSSEPPSTASKPVRQASDGDGTGSVPVNNFDQVRGSLNEARGALTIGTLSPARAKTQYEAYADDYAAASRGVGTLTTDTRPAQLQAAVRQAASAYEVWIRQLESTSWPPEVQPYVDNYLALARTKGRALFKQGLHARSVDDLQGAQALHDTFELSHAQELMREAMGVSD